MSISLTQGNVARLRKEIADLNAKIADESGKSAAKHKEAQRLADSASRSTSQSTVRYNVSRINQLRGEVAQIERRVSDAQKRVAEKTPQLHRYEEQLAKLIQDRDRKAADEEKRRRDAQLKHEQKLARDQAERDRQARLSQQQLHASEVEYQATLTAELTRQAELRSILQAKTAEPKTYDVALSFAGEDREHAEPVAEFLRARGVSVFYDRYEQAELWGKDLYEHLADVYKNRARFCVMFVSKYYAEKLWTTHERKSAQARAFRERQEYILPIRVDDTELPGLHETIGYVSLDSYPIEEICEMLLSKVAPDPPIEPALPGS